MNQNNLSPAFDKKNTLLLPVDPALIDLEPIQKLAAVNGFTKKDEFHITIVGFKNGRLIQQALDQLTDEQLSEVGRQIQILLDQTNWHFTFTPQYYEITKEYLQPGSNKKELRQAYIQMLQLPGLETFYNRFNKILNLDSETPLGHITLYTKSTDPKKKRRGIDVGSRKNFESLKPRLLNLS